jgi:hypothetical protein
MVTLSRGGAETMCMRPKTPNETLDRVNRRFASGGALQEMVTIQQEFHVFDAEVSLRQAYRLLDIGPSDFTERGYYFEFLDRLKTVPSDIAGMNGHDRIIKARKENLESSKPLPMYTKVHSVMDNAGVTITIGSPLPYPKEDHVIISVPFIHRRRPTRPERTAPRKTAR